MKLFDMRKKYDKFKISLESLDKNPFVQFEKWFQEALSCNEVLEANAMQIATVSSGGIPSIRTVLLKSYDENGFVFFTNYKSQKAKEIGNNNNVCLHFFWPALQRQIEITGIAYRVSSMESLKYFSSRPRGSQLGAWVSSQSSVISNRNILQMKLQEMKKKFKQGKIPLPDFWGGYRIKPTKIEFWQGRDDRLHDRFEYKSTNGKFIIDRLSP